MSRFSPKSHAESFVSGVEQRKNELFKNAESILQTPTIQTFRDSYNKEIMGTLGRTAIGGTIDLLDKTLSGSLRSVDGILETGVSTFSFPFGLLGPREQMFQSGSQFLEPAPIHSDFSSYGKQTLGDISQTIFGIGVDDSKRWETGIGGSVRWAFGSIKNIGYNALTLRPIDTANAIVKSGGDALDLVTNTAYSTVEFAKNLSFGGLKSLISKDTSSSEPKTGDTKPKPKPESKTSEEPEEDYNPGDIF